MNSSLPSLTDVEGPDMLKVVFNGEGLANKTRSFLWLVVGTEIRKVLDTSTVITWVERLLFRLRISPP